MPKESKKTKYDNIEVKTVNPLDAAEEAKKDIESAEEIAAEAVSNEQKTRHKPIAQPGSVRQHKPGIVERWVTGVLGPNGAKAIFSRINSEVVLPNLKVIAADSINAAADMMLFGERRHRSGSNNNRGTNAGRAQNYQNSYANRNGRAPGYSRQNARNDWNNQGPGEPEQQVPEYSLQNRRDANDVLNILIGDISRYGQVSVADYKDLLDIPSEFTDHSYGWTDLSMARVVQNFGGRGFTITLPPVEVL